MMNPSKFAIHSVIIAVLCFVAVRANAEDLLMARSSLEFPEAMVNLQEAIKDHGYTISRVQRVDVGLKKLGFKTDKYRVVFFGKEAQVRDLAKRFPNLVPYLPLNFTIFAENYDTIITTVNPSSLQQFYPAAELQPVFAQWEKDIGEILATLRMK
jgi:uncharacterized protein (DUF302 family)